LVIILLAHFGMNVPPDLFAPPSSILQKPQ
jgi:hypothetical protein